MSHLIMLSEIRIVEFVLCNVVKLYCSYNRSIVVDWKVCVSSYRIAIFLIEHTEELH